MENKKNPAAMNTASLLQSCFLMPSPNKRYQLSLEKWLTLALRKQIDNMSLEYLIMPENNTVIKKNKTKNHNDGVQRDTEDNLNSSRDWSSG